MARDNGGQLSVRNFRHKRQRSSLLPTEIGKIYPPFPITGGYPGYFSHQQQPLPSPAFFWSLPAPPSHSPQYMYPPYNPYGLPGYNVMMGQPMSCYMPTLTPQWMQTVLNPMHLSAAVPRSLPSLSNLPDRSGYQSQFNTAIPFIEEITDDNIPHQNIINNQPQSIPSVLSTDKVVNQLEREHAEECLDEMVLDSLLKQLQKPPNEMNKLKKKQQNGDSHDGNKKQEKESNNITAAKVEINLEEPNVDIDEVISNTSQNVLDGMLHISLSVFTISLNLELILCELLKKLV